MIDPREQPVLDILDGMGIKYCRYEHDCVKTMEDCAHIGEEIGARHFKNLFLTNRQHTDYYMLLIREDKKFRTAEVSKQLGVSRLSFCTPDELDEKLGLLPGSVTPMALYRDTAKGITLVVDRDILDIKKVCVHPCVSSASLAIDNKDLFAYVNRFGIKTVYVDIKSTEGEIQ